MVSSIAIQSLSEDIAGTPKGTSQSTITRTNKANGIRFGSKTKSAILERFTKRTGTEKPQKRLPKMSLIGCLQ